MLLVVWTQRFADTFDQRDELMAHAIGTLLGSMLALTYMAPLGAAQSNRGEIGPTSKAAIRISVSVLPRMNIPGVGERGTLGGPSPKEGNVFSNAPGMRYTLVDANTGEPASLSYDRVDGSRTVVLVVPD